MEDAYFQIRSSIKWNGNDLVVYDKLSRIKH
jgi:hypothetical protein